MPTLLQAIACCLDHPNLCRVLGKVAAPHALVLRLVHGQPLALKPDFSSLLRCRWPPGAAFSEDYVHQVACGCSAAMQSLTQLGVAHGDLYAHNLLADPEGEAVLCDYGEEADLGSAWYGSAAASEPSLVKLPILCSTTAWSSLSQLAHVSGVDHWPAMQCSVTVKLSCAACDWGSVAGLDTVVHPLP